MNSHLLRTISIGLAFSSLLCAGQKQGSPAAGAASPEMQQIAAALVGDWSNVETMERSEFFPNGGERKGTSACRLATGGTNLVCQGASNGSAGPLHHLIVIWWDASSKTYGLFVCFQEGKESTCKLRGTAHWEGESFLNDYTEEVNGKPVKMRDSFQQITQRSHVLVAAIESGDGHLRTLITTRSARR